MPYIRHQFESIGLRHCPAVVQWLVDAVRADRQDPAIARFMCMARIVLTGSWRQRIDRDSPPHGTQAGVGRVFVEKDELTTLKAALIVIVSGGMVSGNALADRETTVTTSVGYMSEYIFRGVPQDDSSVNAALDFKSGGFYLGTWGADVGQGVEVDLYAGYNGSIGNLSYGLGTTGYFYTDDFDDTYREVNLSLGYGIFSVSGALGRYDNFAGTTDGSPGATPNRKLDYSFVAPRIDYKGFYGLVGIFGNDFDGEYYEAGYGATLEALGVDWKISYIHSTDTLLGDTDGDGRPDDDNTLTFSVSKSFALTRSPTR
ncbi:MAG: TorF family putative porin [Gammaproteobacteria bacterium]